MGRLRHRRLAVTHPVTHPADSTDCTTALDPADCTAALDPAGSANKTTSNALDYSYTALTDNALKETPGVVCRLCKQLNHMQIDCKLNTTGIYPRGGACHLCGSNMHLARNCPPLAKQEDSLGFSIDVRDADVIPAQKPIQGKPKQKTVVF